MSDIKNRLTIRALRMEPGDFCADLLIAAGTITELEERNKALMEALENIAELSEPGRIYELKELSTLVSTMLSIARAAIAKAKGEEHE